MFIYLVHPISRGEGRNDVEWRIQLFPKINVSNVLFVKFVGVSNGLIYSICILLVLYQTLS